MNFFEFLPLIVILLLQFLYQFQKAARRKKLKSNPAAKGKANSGVLANSYNSSSFSREKNNPTNQEDKKKPAGNSETNSFSEVSPDRFTSSVYRELLEEGLSYPSFKSGEEKRAGSFNSEENYHQENQPYTNDEAEDFNNGEEEADSNEIAWSNAEINDREDKVNQKYNRRSQIVNLLKNNSKKAILLNEILNRPKF